VIDESGQVIHSDDPKEVGEMVARTEEPCVHCHQGSAEALDQVPLEKRWRIIAEPSGHRYLTAMAVVQNEPSCSSASCHHHSPQRKVLGVVDIAYSLDEVDRSMREHTIYIAAMSLAFLLALAVAAAVLLRRQIYVPLRDLSAGARRISEGDLDHKVPVRSDDELGHVANSFNRMQAALQASNQAQAELVQTLETKVGERTKELLAARAEIAQSEKLASIGMLASGVAHELNNPLTGVLTFTTLMRKKAPAGSQDAEDLDLVIRETKRCAAIIKRLLDFAREKVPIKGYFDLNKVVSDTVAFVERSASLQNVEITRRLDPVLPQIWGDADMIKQVVLNILVNAQQAISGPGRIEVSTRRFEGKDKQGKPFSQVEIAFSDTGCGIPEANIERIFDPFFTSKEVGKGTGLGLSVSYGIIKAHGGSIAVESTVGVGTTFRIKLPIQPEAGEAQASEKRQA
jgi:two-component system NtrC family sensor kinase